MKTRRQFMKLISGFFSSLGLILNPLTGGARVAFAKVRKVILPKETRMDSLVSKNPANLDTRNLDLTPVKAFGTMGLDDYGVDLIVWQLKIDGRVRRSLRFTYNQIMQMPSIERNVLLICPGVFAYHARWKGISVGKLLEMAEMKTYVTSIIFSGPKGTYEKTERFPLEDILSNKVFLAYDVNRVKLPKKHGFPLRVVAEDYYGNDWVKYVYRVTANNP